MNAICRVCASATNKLFDHEVLGRHRVSYFACPRCEYIQAEEPFWLDEAYASPISALDTGLVTRNLALRARVAALLILTGNRSGRCIDVGGGCGLFTRLMRDLGFDYYWEDKYAVNILARGFEAKVGAGRVAAVTLLEVLEHAVRPLEFLRQLGNDHAPDMIIVSTETYSGSPPAPNWQYYGFEHGQHVGFFSQRTMKTLAESMSMNIVSAGACHLFSGRRIARWRMNLAMSRVSHLLTAVLRRRTASNVQADYEAVLSSMRK